MTVFMIVSAYLLASLVAYHIEKRIVDAEMPALCAAVWPVRLAELAFLACLAAPVGAIFGTGWAINKGFGWLFGKTDAAVDRIVEGTRGGWRGMRERRLARRLETRTKALAPLRITIPEGAVLGSEEYRRLKPMIEKFEGTMPVMERE